MKRITPEQVVAAYRETGLHPIRHEWFHRKPSGQCACGIGVMCAPMMRVEHIKANIFSADLASSKLNLDQRYVYGFTYGFDGDYRMSYQSEEWKIGYDDGKAAWEAVVAAGLMKE